MTSRIRLLTTAPNSYTAVLASVVLITTLVQSVFAFEVAVGESSIALPAPPGFVEASTLFPPATKLAEKLTPAMNRLLAVYVSDADAQRIQDGGQPVWERYLLVQVERQSEAYRLSPTDFSDAKRVLRAQHEILVQNTAAQVSTFLSSIDSGHDPTPGINVGEALPLGVFSEDDQSISMGNLAKYQRDIGDDYLVVGGTNVILTNDKIIFAYVYTNYATPDDLDWMKQTSADWSRALVETNPTLTGVSALTRVLATPGPTKIVIIMVIAALIGGLTLHIRKRHRRH